MKAVSFLMLLAIAGSSLSLFAQRPKFEVDYAPKPRQLTPYTAPMKPHTKLAEVKARHKGEAEWSEWVVKDEHFWSRYVQSAPESKVSPRFHPDTREWWVILEGQIRFNIEGQEPFVARRHSMVQVPAQTIYSMETIGDQPAIRFETNIAGAKTMYPSKPDFAPPNDNDFMAVRFQRRPFPYGHENKPHINLDDLVAADPDYHGSRFVHDDRGVSNIIYGYNSKLPPLNPKDRGHFHPEGAEFWVIMLGQIRYAIEGQGVIVASEGDVVYVPKNTFHAPRWWGDGPSCRLAINGYPDIAHLYEPPD